MYRFILLLVVFSFSQRGVLSQGCDEKLLIKGKELGTLGYQPRGDQSRCEGLYYDNVSGVSLDLVSFTEGKLSYQLRTDEILQLRWPADSAIRGGWIRGTSIRARPRYRLDLAAERKKNNILLPVNDVLNASRIACSDLGVFGFFERKQSTVYFPVSASSKFNKQPTGEAIYVILVSNVDAERVVYKIAENKNGICGIFVKETPLAAPFEKLEPLEITISREHRKELCLEVSVLPAGSTQWITRQFLLHLPARQ